MIFDDSYFEDEVREGFYVCSMMKRYWAAQMEVMQVVFDICKRNNIKVFADFGTLLGAVRHHGFIPWDDDVDVCMLREDLNRFASVAENELPEGWVLFRSEDERYLQPWYRVTNSDRIFIEDEDLVRYHGCQYPVGLDIFIIDHMAPIAEFNVLKPIIDLMIYYCFNEEDNPEKKETSLKGIEDNLNVSLPRGDVKATKKEILKVLQLLLGSYNSDDSDHLLGFSSLGYGTYRYKKEWFEEAVWLPFENMSVPVPCGYKGVLTAEFGNYMTAVIAGAGHEYPAYIGAQREYEEKVGVSSEYKPEKEEVISQVCRPLEKRNNKVIFFLPYKSSGWEYMEPFWKAAASDASNQVYVMPIPYFRKHYSGELQEQIYEPEGYPEYVKITRLEDINIEAFDIDEIYIQQPFDERNLAISVHPYFYAPHMRNICRRLIYVPDFELIEFAFKSSIIYKTFVYFAAMPGVIYADKTMVQSDNMRQKYIDYLCEWMGDDTREFWSDKITARMD